MNNTIAVTAPKAGLCPHGLPPSACPICSNMGGGGSRKSELSFKSAPPQMMSWNQCEAIGFFLKGQRRGVERRHEAFKELAITLANHANNLAKLAARLEQLSQSFGQNLIGIVISFPIKNILLPTIKFLQSSFNKAAEVSDKIATMLGEMKKGLEKALENIKKISEEIKHKLFKLFAIFGTHKSDENENKIDEEKKIFNLKKILKLIQRKQDKDKK